MFRHVAIGGEETVDSAVVAVGHHSAFDARIICQAVTEAKSVSRSKGRFRHLHPQDRLGFHQLNVACFSPPQEKLNQFRELTWRSFQVSRGPQVDEWISHSLRR